MPNPERALHLVTADHVLEPTEFNLEPRNPDAARGVLESWLAFAAAIEHEVPEAAAVADLLTPNRDEELETFHDHWLAQEIGHGVLLAETADILGVKTIPEVAKATTRMQVLGFFARHSARLEELTTLTYLVYGAIAEDETMRSYRLVADKLDTLDEPETGISSMLRAVATQEARHRAYYIGAAEKRKTTSSEAVRFLLRHGIEKWYTPVGVPAGDVERLRAFGGALIGTTGEDFTDITDRAEKVAFDLTGARPGFLSRTYTRAIEEFTQAA